MSEGDAVRLVAIATAARGFLESVWPRWHAAHGVSPRPPSTATCGRSSLFLVRVLDELGIAARWTNGTPRHVEGGPEIGPLGFFDGQRWRAHAWVASGPFILDVTADQFGAPPVLVVPADDARYRQGGGDTALPEFRAARRRAVDVLMPHWRQSSPARDLSRWPEGRPRRR